MRMNGDRLLAAGIGLAALALVAVTAAAWSPLPVKEDPLVRMPGSQPPPEGNVSLEGPNRCFNCHAGFNPAVEPGFNWKGSMMAQAGRDFLFFACLTTAAQDSIWAIGRPNATDICLRCHFPKGWVEGRSDPTNASLMIGADWDGVQCDYCHTSFDPFFEGTYSGVREGADWLGYWDETNASSTPSQPAADATYQEDLSQAQGIALFDGSPFFGADNWPMSSDYTENASGQYFLSTGSQKRASFADAAARHQMLYSRYHKSKHFCATCHDVSNPILANLLYSLGGDPNASPTGNLWTEENPASSFFHVERTFSEFMLSDYGRQGGAPTNPEFQAQGAPEITRAAKCQDCHMRDVVGTAADKRGVPIRPDDSIEHPQSGQPLHDLTGGNVWVSTVLASAVPGSPNYDATNDGLLNQGPAVLTLDLTQGEGIDPQALLAGADRARQQLLLAATITDLSYDGATGALSFRVQNNSGHKLISGFPEGRRMFVNVRAYDTGGNLIQEINPYDAAAGTLKGLDYPYQPDPGLPDPAALGTNEAHLGELVYEMHPKSTLTGEDHTFHFALATGRYKDNRIPPRGFRVAEAAARLAVPVADGVENPGLFTADEYAGGYDEVALMIGPGAAAVEVNLYYQTTSREYIEFLRDEINGTGNLTLSSPTPSEEPQAYIAQTDPFFDQLKAWGDTIWQLWTHNRDIDGAAPFLMAQAAVGEPPPGCSAPTPTLLTAAPGHQQVTLEWSDEHGGDPLVTGYRVYYDQAAKGQFIAEVGLVTSHTDSGLTNGQQYCYKVTASYDAACESDFGNVLCAIPNNQGQAEVGVDGLETGYYSGKGKNRTFVAAALFQAGDEVIVRAWVMDGSTGLPVANATVDLELGGPETHLLTSAPSDADGMAEAVWNTQKPNRQGQGGTTPGLYEATVTGVTADGYTWDGAMRSVTFTIE